MKWLKRSLYLLGGLFALLAIVLTAFLATFDANDYRPQMVDLVKQQTGRDLTIDGDIELILFSWRPGLSLGSIRLSNAPGFGEQAFAELGSARVELEWLPLLRDRALKIVQVQLNGLRLRLARNSAGVGNWEDLAGAPAEPAEAPTEPAPPGPGEAPAGAQPLGIFTLGDLAIRDALVEWRDEQAGTRAEVRDFDLDSGRVSLGQPFPLNFGFNLENNQPAVQARVDFQGMVTVDPQAQRYSISGLGLDLKAQGAALPVPAIEARLASDVAVDLRADTASLAGLRLNFLGLDLGGQVQVRQLTASPGFDATLALAGFDARQLMQRLQLPAPETDDPEVLKSVSLDLAAKGGLDAVEVSRLLVKLDQSTLQGTLAARDLAANPAIRFELALDQLDADRYLPTPPPKIDPPPEAPAADVPEAPLPIPLELLRQLDVEGRFKAGSLKVQQARMQDLDLGLRLRDGQLTLDPLAVNLYDGLLRGDLALDARQDRPKVRTRLKLAGVRSEPLLNDVLDLDLVRGKADASIELSTAGIRISEFKRNLNGSIGASFADGALKGFNLAALLREAEARLAKRAVDDARESRATDFAVMKVSATVVNGVLQSDDLDVRAPLLRLNGEGRVDLVEEQLNYLARVTLTDQQTGQGGAATDQLKGLTVPIRVSGAFADPKISVELAKALEQRARAALQKEAAKAEARLKANVEAEKARLQEKADAEKARAQQKLDAEKARLAAQKAEAEAKLKADAEAEKKRAAEKLKQNLGDQLKKLF